MYAAEVKNHCPVIDAIEAISSRLPGKELNSLTHDVVPGPKRAPPATRVRQLPRYCRRPLCAQRGQDEAWLPTRRVSAPRIQGLALDTTGGPVPGP